MEERKKIGLGETVEAETKISMRGTQKTITKTNKLMEAPQRLLQEEDINIIYDELCKKCQERVDGYVYLTCGRGG
jgi:hypothetical protein